VEEDALRRPDLDGGIVGGDGGDVAVPEEPKRVL